MYAYQDETIWHFDCGGKTNLREIKTFLGGGDGCVSLSKLNAMNLSKRVNCMVCELYLDKAVQNM